MSDDVSEKMGTADTAAMIELRHKRELLSEFRSMNQFEHTMFWNRFIAFSALNAGLFATLGGSGLTMNVAVVGFILSTLWVLIQWRSMKDVKKAKKSYHRARRAAGAFFTNNEEADFKEGKPDSYFENQRSNFNVLESGASASLLIFSVWTYMLFSDYQHQLQKLWSQIP